MSGRPDRRFYSSFLFLLHKLEIEFFGSELMRENGQKRESLDAVRGIGSFVVIHCDDRRSTSDVTEARVRI